MEGITRLEPADIAFAHNLGYVIKLLAIAERDADGRLALRVHPTLVHKDDVPDTDELLVSRIRKAGGIVMGKTNTPEFGAGANTVDGPTLGISEAWRYLPVMSAGVLITLFAIEHLIAQFTGSKVVSSWH